MPMRKFKKNVRRIAKRGARKGRNRRKSNQTSGNIKVKQYARCVEVVPFTQPTANTDVNYQFNISQFARATEIAKNFKFYRAKRVVWSYLPEYNTFQSGVGSVSMPQLSMIMNRTGDNSAWGLAEYDAQGAVPMTFAKKRVIAYKPNLVQPFNVAIGGISPDTPPQPTTIALGNTPVYTKWIGTTAYRVNALAGPATDLIIRGDLTPYYGHSLYWAVTSTAPDEPALATVFCEVEWEFKDPLFDDAPSGATALVAQPKKTH